MDFYVNGANEMRLEADGDLQVDGDVIEDREIDDNYFFNIVKDNSFDKLLAVNVIYFLHPIIDYAREFFRILKINGLGVLVCKFEGIKNFDNKVAPNKNLEDIVNAFEKAGFRVKTEFIKSNNTQKEYHAIYLRKSKNEP